MRKLWFKINGFFIEITIVYDITKLLNTLKIKVAKIHVSFLNMLLNIITKPVLHIKMSIVDYILYGSIKNVKSYKFTKSNVNQLDGIVQNTMTSICLK